MILRNKTEFKALVFDVIEMIERGEIIEGQEITYPFDFLGLSINDDRTVDIYRRVNRELSGYDYTEAKQGTSGEDQTNTNQVS